MAPLVPIFSADSLPDHVNTVRRNFQEKRRKGEQVNLKDCPLLEMTQFSCNPPQNGVPEPGVVAGRRSKTKASSEYETMRGTTLHYEYAFGRSWLYGITITCRFQE